MITWWPQTRFKQTYPLVMALFLEIDRYVLVVLARNRAFLTVILYFRRDRL